LKLPAKSSSQSFGSASGQTSPDFGKGAKRASDNGINIYLIASIPAVVALFDREPARRATDRNRRSGGPTAAALARIGVRERSSCNRIPDVV
jgi:hypothetical protein